MENIDRVKWNCFIDTNSGLVCCDPENGNAQRAVNANLIAIGVWKKKFNFTLNHQSVLWNMPIN